MALTIELTPEQEDRLRREAARRGMDAERCAADTLATHLAEPPAGEPSLWDTLTPEEWGRATDTWIARQDPAIPPLSECAILCESRQDEQP